MQTVIQKNIPLELCPTSNLIVSDLSDFQNIHIKDLISKGLTNFTVCTDDILLFDSSLSEEWGIMAELFEYDIDTIQNQIRKSASMIMADEKVKEWLNKELERPN